ncbi:MAG: hypothetical protein ACLGIV_12125 [Actinomycetes bacterium]
MLDLPRAARLALWGTTALHGDASAADAARAVQRDDEPHTVTGDVTVATTLVGLLDDCRAAGATSLRTVLPAAGDPQGLTGPPEATVAATDAGEAAVVATARATLALVPDVTVFGSHLEPGAMVDWRVLAVNPLRPPTESLADADRALREALRAATEALAQLDVSRWREDAADRIVAVRDGGLLPDVLPPGTDPRVARVVATAARVRAIVELALEDDGAAVTGWEATRRAAALRDVDAVARRCLAAALDAQTGGQAGRPSTVE